MWHTVELTAKQDLPSINIEDGEIFTLEYYEDEDGIDNFIVNGEQVSDILIENILINRIN